MSECTSCRGAGHTMAPAVKRTRRTLAGAIYESTPRKPQRITCWPCDGRGVETPKAAARRAELERRNASEARTVALRSLVAQGASADWCPGVDGDYEYELESDGAKYIAHVYGVGEWSVCNDVGDSVESDDGFPEESMLETLLGAEAAITDWECR